MVAVRTWKRAAISFLLGGGVTVWYACSDRPVDPLTGPSASPPSLHVPPPDLRVAIAAQERHEDDILKVPGVVGTAVGVLPDGRAHVQILLERSGVAGLPTSLDGVPVALKVTGRLMAFSDPTKRQRPAPLGFSVGHPSITAGTIGARVRDQSGNVYILSNNHVLANSNGATPGDAAIQPGPYDGGTIADRIGTLSVYKPIVFAPDASNTMDAAIARSSIADLDNATPSDDGYGMPTGRIYGDANGDGMFDDRNALLGLHVQKYGRTTKLTHGVITGVNATVSICYEVSGLFCSVSARFVDQLIITPPGFSAGGDSGSLIVTDDTDRSPVGLLFAGSDTETISNRIDLVLNQFGVTIDAPPPGPLSDVAVTAITVSPSVARDSAVNVSVTVRNVGNQPVTGSFDLTLRDATDNVTIGTQSVGGLAVGASATLNYHWNTSASPFGPHTLVASHTLTDDYAPNNQRSATVSVDPPLTDLAITSVTGPVAVTVGATASIAVRVANLGNQNVGTSFDVTLRDATSGTNIGTQSIAGLAPGTNTTLNFNWNTTNASFGGHVLVATHSVTDDNALNNVRSVNVTISPPRTDVSLTDFSGPSSVAQGTTGSFTATVQNVGERDVGSFAVVLSDLTNGVAIDTETVPSLAMGATSTVTLSWNTTTAATGGHTLMARQMLADDSVENDSRAIGMNVSPPPNSPTDVGVTALTVPATVGQGTTASIGVTVQNLGQQPVGASFNVILTDATTGTTIGTQTVPNLGVGATSTVTFNWNTTGVTLGSHTITASHNFADNNAANNQRSAAIAINAKITDIAMTAFTVPNPVTQGTTVNITVTVRNAGEQDVTTGFDVVVTDASAGVTIGTQTVATLAMGASTTLTFPWNTTGVATGGHTLMARQTLNDWDGTNNSRAAGINVNAPVVQLTDVAVTGINAPSSVRVGQTVNVQVGLGNGGTQNITTSFTVTLQDATDNVTLGTQTVGALGVGASTAVSFTWNAANASIGNHTLVATHALADGNTANNQRSLTVPVTPPIADVSVNNVTTPGSVTQGATANIGVVVQNVGDVDVGSFNVVLTDATAGVTIGTQTVNNLARGVSSIVNFSWNTENAALGSHTLTATHSLVDGNAANNQRSTTMNVNRKMMDLALTSFTIPNPITQGSTVNIGVTVQNIGQQDVATSFNIVVTDASAGVTIGTQPVTGLAIGASTTITFPWTTTGVATGGHTLFARQTLPDDNPYNNSSAAGISVTPPSLHVGNLNRTSSNNGDNWTATIEITVHDASHTPVSGAIVRGGWGSTTSECTTGATGPGSCTVVSAPLPNSTNLVSFAVSSATTAGYVYQPSANHDPDGSSNGTTIFVFRPQ